MWWPALQKNRHLGEIAAGMVVAERNDIITITDGRMVDVPMMGLFEIANSAIFVWRDYLDAAAKSARHRRKLRIYNE